MQFKAIKVFLSGLVYPLNVYLLALIAAALAKMSDNRRYYGFFHCHSCDNRWESGSAYKYTFQKCQKCDDGEYIRPYRVVSYIMT